MKRFTPLLAPALACLVLSGCALNKGYYKVSGDWEVFQLIEKRQQTDTACQLTFRIANNTDKIFMGANASFQLIDKNLKEIRKVTFYQEERFHTGYGATYQRTVEEPCDAIADIRILYLQFATAYGYFTPKNVKTELRETREWTLRPALSGPGACALTSPATEPCL